MCDGRAPHPLRLLAVAAEPAFADDADVDALLGQKCFQFVDANVRHSIPINGAAFRFLRQPSNPKAPSPAAKSGKAAAVGE